MLSVEQNNTLTETGRGTLMGEFLRRYWWPVAAETEFDEKEVKPIRLMGEDLVLYRDKSGTYGLLDRQCPHRRADLSYGFVEDCGLRCNYHGWLYDQAGRCTAQPYEETAHPDAHFKDKVTIKAYRVQPLAGLLWAYLGPDPAPLVPNWEPFTWSNGFRQIAFTEVPCNWLQGQENSIDPVHFEWLHDNWSRQLRGGSGPVPAKHLRIRFEEFDYGFHYQRIREGQKEGDELWTIGRTCLWPNCLFTGEHFEWRVPIDDGHMLSVGWFYNRVPHEMEPFVQDKIPYWNAPLTDPASGRWISTHVMNQDFIAWVGQGTISDRQNEHLGESDRGVILMRKRMLEEAELVAQGGEPKATIRDPQLNQCVRMPIVGRDRLLRGFSLADSDSAPPFGLREFPFLAGQPEAIRQAYWHAMGRDIPPARDNGPVATRDMATAATR